MQARHALSRHGATHRHGMIHAWHCDFIGVQIAHTAPFRQNGNNKIHAQMTHAMISQGDTIPPFELENSDGDIVRSSDFAGKRYVIYFYPKDFTPGCTTEADEFAKTYEKFKEVGIEVIGISPDSAESHGKFCKKIGIPYILLSDVQKEVSKKFGVWGMKKFMGREYMGVHRSTFLVDEGGTIIKSYPKVKPAGHAQQVLDDFASAAGSGPAGQQQ